MRRQQFALNDNYSYTKANFNQTSLDCSLGSPLQKQLKEFWTVKNMTARGRGLSR